MSLKNFVKEIAYTYGLSEVEARLLVQAMQREVDKSRLTAVLTSEEKNSIRKKIRATHWYECGKLVVREQVLQSVAV